MSIFSAMFGGAGAMAKRARAASDRATGNTPAAADPSGPAGRRRPPTSTAPGNRSGSRNRGNRTAVGQAVPRPEAATIGGGTEPPPALGADASNAARAAALRARRKGAGSSALANLKPGGADTPRAVLSRTALGGGY